MSEKYSLIARTEAMEINRLETEPFGTNAYMVSCRMSGSLLLVDAPGSAADIMAHLDGNVPCLIVITHAHMDHLTALEEISAKLQAPVAVHGNDAAGLPLKPERILKDGDIIECGSLKLRVLHTPGHTPGSICLYIPGYLLSGDTIFPGGPGKTGTPQDFKQITDSLRIKVFTLPDDTVILPGHGEKGLVKEEKAAFDSFTASGAGEGLCGDVTWS